MERTLKSISQTTQRAERERESIERHVLCCCCLSFIIVYRGKTNKERCACNLLMGISSCFSSVLCQRLRDLELGRSGSFLPTTTAAATSISFRFVLFVFFFFTRNIFIPRRKLPSSSTLNSILITSLVQKECDDERRVIKNMLYLKRFRLKIKLYCTQVLKLGAQG